MDIKGFDDPFYAGEAVCCLQKFLVCFHRFLQRTSSLPLYKMHPSNVVLQIDLCVRSRLAFFTGKLLFWSFSCVRFLVVVQSSSCLQRLVTYFADILLAAKFFGEVHFMITKMKQNEL